MNSSLNSVPMESIQIDLHQLLSRVRRVVVKVGNTTISQNFNLNAKRLDRLVQDLATAKRHGKEVLLVTSGTEKTKCPLDFSSWERADTSGSIVTLSIIPCIQTAESNFHLPNASSSSRFVASITRNSIRSVCSVVLRFASSINRSLKKHRRYSFLFCPLESSP